MIIIRQETEKDYKAVEKVTFDAFETMDIPEHPYTDEHILARLLREDEDFVPELDLVAELEGEIVGNIMYSRCRVVRANGEKTLALVFGPLSVKPELHKKGIGRMLVERSLEIAREMGYGAVIITGHPDYYKRFGFVPAREFNLTMGDGTEIDAFMALELIEGYLGKEGGSWELCAAFQEFE
ncbi:N-acetyltransferase, partial [Clostridiaceae bacterium OttesenSCG-928-D20]|nr:N-acetyltransferase [Clostridiaceae bacterium OttesenSCG-928-D20]